jgi:sulfite exporter TauE/SafE
MRNKLNFRGMLDFFMAILMACFGLFIMFSKNVLGYDYFADNLFLQGSIKWIVGILFIFYALFRAYRGYIIFKNGQP